MSDLYDNDILVWSEHQSSLLRRLAAGERVNGQIDWENVVEEIESVGREQLHAVESLLTNALLHQLRTEGWPLSRDVENWRADARLFHAQARRRFARSMLQKIDVAGLYADAIRAMPTIMDGRPPLPVPVTCPFTLNEVLDGDFLAPWSPVRTS